MYITNVAILAIELKKLIGDGCTVDLVNEHFITVHIDRDSIAHSRSGRIEVHVPNDDNGTVNITVRYNIQKEQIPEIEAKLDTNDILTVCYNGASVYKERIMYIPRFNGRSPKSVENIAKSIVDTMRSL